MFWSKKALSDHSMQIHGIEWKGRFVLADVNFTYFVMLESNDPIRFSSLDCLHNQLV